LTRAGEYAVRCMLYLASLGTGELAMRKEIARAMDIPEQFLGKIAQQLSWAGFIDIVQGAKGGHRLVVPPQKLTLLDVVEAVVSEIFIKRLRHAAGLVQPLERLRRTPGLGKGPLAAQGDSQRSHF
jgi:Rrf2 family protein